MKLQFTPIAWRDYLDWQKIDRKLAFRINELINETLRNPFQGLGKPEPLKYALAGCWSRRIDEQHRLIYKVQDGFVIIISVKHHY